MSIGAFARFGIADIPGLPTSRQRAQQGSECHRTLAEETALAEPNASFEIPLHGTWIADRWTLHLHGRIDQLIRTPDSGCILREIKSTYAPLPIHEEDLCKDYPHYLNQLAAYLVLTHLQTADAQLGGELVFVQLDTQARQTLILSLDEAYAHFKTQWQRLLPYVERRWTRRTHAAEVAPPPLFEHYREGQKSVLAQLEHSLTCGNYIAFEAPTGFGKTALALQAGLTQLHRGQCERILYLSSKSTGQLQAVRELERASLHSSTGLRYFCLRNQQEHASGSGEITTLPDKRTLLERWQACALTTELLFENGTVSLERIQKFGQEAGIPPYWISLDLLRHAEIWIADYNYLFAPDTRHIFEQIPDFDPRKTFLIIDEAHNLPERVCDAFSSELNAEVAWLAHDALQNAHAPAALLSALESFAEVLGRLTPCERLSPHSEEDFGELIALLYTEWMCLPEPADTSEDWLIEFMRALKAAHRLLSNAPLAPLAYCPRKGTLALVCLAAGDDLASQLKKFSATLFMSATFPPLNTFAESCGLAPALVRSVVAEAPWHEQAFTVAIDTRADTRYNVRERSYALTAETLLSCLRAWTPPIAVFFSSYPYATTLRDYLQAADPFCRVALQKKGLKLADQQRFIDESLLTCDALFLVLGSGFSESVDMLGGRIQAAVVVGPALPEVNPIQKARMDACAHLGRDAAFERVYVLPAMRKIRQAIGRLIREPGHHAHILLHEKRFAHPEYLRYLNLPQTPTLIHTHESLDQWLFTNQP